MPSGIVMMYWDCPSCGNKEIAGENRTCTNCGKERTVQCYIIEGKGEITDSKGIADARSGPDWQCGKCGHFNTAKAGTCENCHSSKGDGTVNKVISYAPGVVPTTTDQPQQQEASPDRMAWRSDPDPDYGSDRIDFAVREGTSSSIHRTGSKDFLKMAGIALVLAAILFGVWFLFIRKMDVTVNVSGFSWQRSVVIEKYSWTAESSLSGFPAGSRNQHQEWEIIGYHQEPDGSHTEYRTECHSEQRGENCSYTDLGNGRASRDCSPNYDQVCESVGYEVPDYKTVADWGYNYYYEVQRWVHSRTPVSGGQDRKVYWPEFTLRTESDPEREARRSEVYVIHYKDGESKEYTRQVGYSEMKDLPPACHAPSTGETKI